MEIANKQPLDSPISSSFNELQLFQTLGSNKPFAVHCKSDYFPQKVIGMLKNTDSTEINRLPDSWREKFENFNFDNRDYLYMDERLVISKLLRIFSLSLEVCAPDTMSEIECWPKSPTSGYCVFSERKSELQKPANSVK